MHRTLLILRAHRGDAQTFAAFDRYAALPGLDVLIACDERRGPVDMGLRRKASYDVPRLRGMGLLPHPKCGWRCGDYAYYVARTHCPDYDFYWLTEPDVWVNTADLPAFMAAFEASDADFLASRLRTANPGWDWHATMAARYERVHACIFPITRLSRRAIDHLHAARRAARRPPSDEVFAAWPNDEVFVATELMNHGFSCADINAVRPGSYTEYSLRTGLPHDRDSLQSQPPDGLIYHPVREFAAWLRENAEWAADAGLRMRDRPEEPPLRDHVMRLFRLARTCLEKPEFREAALVPLLIIRGSDCEAPAPWPDRAATRAEAARLLTQYFTSDVTRAAARVYPVLGLTTPMEGHAARIDDFAIGPGETLAKFPVGHALPYARCSERRIQRYTLHAWPIPPIASEQRRLAAFVCDVPYE